MVHVVQGSTAGPGRVQLPGPSRVQLPGLEGFNCWAWQGSAVAAGTLPLAGVYMADYL